MEDLFDDELGGSILKTGIGIVHVPLGDDGLHPGTHMAGKLKAQIALLLVPAADTVPDIRAVLIQAP